MNIKQLQDRAAATRKARLTKTPTEVAQVTSCMSYQDMIKQPLKYKPMWEATRPEYKLYLTVGNTHSKRMFKDREEMVTWYKACVHKTIDSVSYACIAGYTVVYLTAVLKQRPKDPAEQVRTVKDECGNAQVTL